MEPTQVGELIVGPDVSPVPEALMPDPGNPAKTAQVGTSQDVPPVPTDAVPPVPPIPVDIDELLAQRLIQRQVDQARFDGLGFRIGSDTYYNIHELALLFRVPVYVLQRAWDEGALQCQKIQELTLVTAESFKTFICSPRWGRYKRRRYRNRTQQDDDNLSIKTLETQGQRFQNSQKTVGDTQTNGDKSI